LPEFPAIKSLFLADINTALSELCRLFRLPDLVDSDTITVTGGDTGIVVLPADYCWKLFEVTSTTNNGESIRIRTNIQVMNSEYTDTQSKIGRVVDVAENGSNLHCLPVPTADEDLLIRFYRKPATLVNDDDVPEGIPDYLQEDLLVGYIVKKRFSLVSEQMQLKTQRYIDDYNFAARKLQSYCRNSPKQRPYIARKKVWF
jgi:hypothetical protein